MKKLVVNNIENININEEYANILPKLSELEFQKLKESIKANGLWYPIIVNSEGIILDGHHRFKACQELGVVARTETKEFANPLLENRFIIESNLERRQLNDFQRIELALKLKPIFKEIARKNMSLGGHLQEHELSDCVPCQYGNLMSQNYQKPFRISYSDIL